MPAADEMSEQRDGDIDRDEQPDGEEHGLSLLHSQQNPTVGELGAGLPLMLQPEGLG